MEDRTLEHHVQIIQIHPILDEKKSSMLGMH
jgi:hypothetical protein